MQPNYLVPDDVLQYLRGRLARGELGVFTGAGFSSGGIATDGSPIPSVKELKAILWPIAFPSTDLDDLASLGDIFDCALQQSPGRLRETLENCLRVDDRALPAIYEEWFRVPWRRMYTVNIDDLDAAALRRFALPLQYRVISYKSAVPSQSSATWVVHLNGVLDDFPDVTFSAPQYAARLPGREPWYATLAADLLNNAFIFVGTSLDEPPLWQHLELRGTRGPRLVELRPRSFLVAPELSQPRQRLLTQFNIEWIPLSAEEFARQVFPALAPEIERGTTAIQQRQASQSATPSYRLISDLRSEARPTVASQYLLGRAPHWSDITDGFAITRAFETQPEPSRVLLAPRFTLFTGTAGTGKTTTLMRACLELEASGLKVGWVDTDAELPVRRFREAIAAEELDVLGIDDLDVFRAQAAPLITGLLRDRPELRILAAARSSRADRFGLLDFLNVVDGKNVVVPSLEDADIDLLLDALAAAGVSGELRGMSIGDQRLKLREHCGRQLLVSMIEVTSGRPFRDKIEDECHQLEGDARFLYSLVALATRSRSWLSRQEVLVASNAPSLDTLNSLEQLVRQHLIIEPRRDQLVLRHRVVAEVAVDYYRRERHLAAAVRGLLFAMATQEVTLANRSSRQFRLLRQLINHKFLSEEVGDLAQVRGIYDEVQTLLMEDYHFFLQRGSLEVEVGDLSLAENYLRQAHGMNESDFRVQTASAYMNLKKASRDAAVGASGWREGAADAFAELSSALDTRGAEDSYPWHIFGSQGLAYVRRAPLQPSEKAQILDMLRGRMNQALRLHSGSAELRQLRDDVEREYLLLSVDPAQLPTLPES